MMGVRSGVRFPRTSSITSTSRDHCGDRNAIRPRSRCHKTWQALLTVWLLPLLAVPAEASDLIPGMSFIVCEIEFIMLGSYDWCRLQQYYSLSAYLPACLPICQSITCLLSIYASWIHLPIYYLSSVITNRSHLSSIC